MFRLNVLFIVLLTQFVSMTPSLAAPCSVSYQKFYTLSKRVEKLSKLCGRAMDAGIHPTKMCAVCKPFAAEASKFERLARNKNCFASERDAARAQAPLTLTRQVIKFSRRYCGS